MKIDWKDLMKVLYNECLSVFAVELIEATNKARSDRGASVFGNIIGVVLLVISVISDPLLAETDPLTELGIDPKILDVMVSDLSQDLAYTQQVDNN